MTIFSIDPKGFRRVLRREHLLPGRDGVALAGEGLSLADLIGLDSVLGIMEPLYTGFEDSKYRRSPLLKQMCDAGYLGRKTGKGFFSYEAPA